MHIFYIGLKYLTVGSCICSNLSIIISELESLLVEADELIAKTKSNHRRLTFIEVSKQNWDHVRASITANFMNGMKSRGWNVGTL